MNTPVLKMKLLRIPLTCHASYQWGVHGSAIGQNPSDKVLTNGRPIYAPLVTSVTSMYGDTLYTPHTPHTPYIRAKGTIPFRKSLKVMRIPWPLIVAVEQCLRAPPGSIMDIVDVAGICRLLICKLRS